MTTTENKPAANAALTDAYGNPLAMAVPPSFDSIDEERAQRWDRASVHEFSGTYGDYLVSKVSKVFPQLRETVL